MSDFDRFLTLFGPRPIWYVQGGDGHTITDHRRFDSADDLGHWVKENGHAAVYFEVQSSVKVVDTRPSAEHIDTLFAFPIDIDPVTETRPAAEEERQPCFEVSNRIADAVVQKGLGRPALSTSGNGAQVFVRLHVELRNETERTKWRDLFSRMQHWVQTQFADPRVSIDSVADFARLMALPGSIKKKLVGIDAPTEERPFRAVAILDDGEPTSTEAFEKFASSLPAMPEIEVDDVEFELIDVDDAIMGIHPKIEALFQKDFSKGAYALAAELLSEGRDTNTTYSALVSMYEAHPKPEKRLRAQELAARAVRSALASPEVATMRAIRENVAKLKPAPEIEPETSPLAVTGEEPNIPGELVGAVAPIKKAIEVLARDDPDKAKENNGVGFNAWDSDEGRALARTVDEWKIADAKRALRMLEKYGGKKGQLVASGFDFKQVAGNFEDALKAYEAENRAREAEKGGEEKKTIADKLIEVGDAMTDQLFLDENGTPFISLKDGKGGVRALQCDSKEFNLLLTKEYFSIYGKAPNAEARASAINVFEANALGKKQIELGLRFTKVGDVVYYDFANAENQVVKITKDGWTIERQTTPIFRRYPHMKAQVLPVKEGADIGLIFNHVLVEEQEKALYLADLVTTVFGELPRPVPVLPGGKGTQKSSRQKMFKTLLDPSSMMTLGLSDDPKELAQQLAHNAVVVFDNVYYIKGEISDVLCRAVTGDGVSKRTLFTNDEDHIWVYHRKILVNGTRNPLTKSDALDRIIEYETKKVVVVQDEEKVWREFEENLPKILGGLFDAVAASLRDHDEVAKKLEGKLPRMADFTIYGEAAVRNIAGYKKLAFFKAYVENRKGLNDSVLEESLIARCIMKLFGDMKTTESRTYTYKELLDLLKSIADALKIKWEEASKEEHPRWPKSPKGLAGFMSEVESNLAEVGIIITRKRHTRTGTTVTITRVEVPTGDGDDGDDSPLSPRAEFESSSENIERRREEKVEKKEESPCGYTEQSSQPSHAREADATTPATSTGQIVQHTYSAPGNYKVSLTATDGASRTVTVVKEVVV